MTLYFDRSDPAERKALEAARLLAAKHGRRKQAIIALLEAVYNHYEATGELLSSAEISGLLMGQGSTPARAQVGFTQAIAQAHGLELSAENASTPSTRPARWGRGSSRADPAPARRMSRATS